MNQAERTINTTTQPRHYISFKDLSIAFQTIKAINMPPRSTNAKGEPDPPEEGEYPYGPTEDHKTSMLIYWLDDCEMSYAGVWYFYCMCFDIVSVETLRRRHLRALIRLEQRYGAKPVDQIGPLGPTVLRRGRTKGE